MEIFGGHSAGQTFCGGFVFGGFSADLQLFVKQKLTNYGNLARSSRASS